MTLAWNRDPAAKDMLEEVLLSHVLELAKVLKLRTAHFRPARTASGWRTAVQGDGKGFPDLLILGPRSMIVVELKRQSQKPDEAQEAWLAAWRAVGVVATVWRPSEWLSGEVERVLKALARGAAFESETWEPPPVPAPAPPRALPTDEELDDLARSIDKLGKWEHAGKNGEVQFTCACGWVSDADLVLDVRDGIRDHAELHHWDGPVGGRDGGGAVDGG